MDFTLVQASGASTQGGQPGYHYDYRKNEVSSISNGAIYYVVLYGIPGSAMPQFKGQLPSEKIWDVGNYVGWAFMGWKLEPYSGRYEELAQAKRPWEHTWEVGQKRLASADVRVLPVLAPRAGEVGDPEETARSHRKRR